jgi:2-haloacid dehalogenase
MRLHDFKVLSFDCYGTLIDWETGILAALAPLLDGLAAAPSREDVLARFGHFEAVQQRATPTKRYSDILAIVYKRLAEAWERPASWEAALAFGASVPAWPAFPDSAEALAELAQRYKLVVLSNVDNASFAASNARLGVTFDAVFTAEETGVYKPHRAGFDYMLARLEERGLGKSAVLHTAQSLFHDHATAAGLGLARCFIDRHAARPGAAATPLPEGLRPPEFRFDSMAALAAAVRDGSA